MCVWSRANSKPEWFSPRLTEAKMGLGMQDMYQWWEVGGICERSREGTKIVANGPEGRTRMGLK